MRPLGLVKLRNFFIYFTLLLVFFLIPLFFMDKRDKNVEIIILFLAIFSLFLDIAIIWWFSGFPKCYLLLTDKYLKVPEASFFGWTGAYLSIPLSEINEVDVGYDNDNYYLQLSVSGSYATETPNMILGHIQHELDENGVMIIYRIYVTNKKLIHVWKKKLATVIS